MIDLQKRLITLQKQARLEIERQALTDFRAQVAVVLDISKSMYPLYHVGVMQNAIERLLALAMHFDDNQQIDAFVFGTTAHALAPITLPDIPGYIEREILAHHHINGATKYATAFEVLRAKYRLSKQLSYVIFITDGNNSDKKEAEAWLQKLAALPMFIKFVGIGKEEFPFLSQLKGRNVNFVQINDLSTVSDSELYRRLLTGVKNYELRIKN